MKANAEFRQYLSTQAFDIQPETQESSPKRPDLKQLFAKIIRFLSSNSEPRIEFKRDRLGNHFWRVYDPNTNQSATFSSELEVRIWLEQRYVR